jgi:hypothetical protein
VRQGEFGVEILADPAGLRDLARLCLALTDEQEPDGSHVHLDRGTIPFTPARTTGRSGWVRMPTQAVGQWRGLRDTAALLARSSARSKEPN